MRLLSLALIGACLVAAVSAGKYHRTADSLIRSISSLQQKDTTGFGVYIQLAKPDVLVSSLEAKHGHKPITVVVPSNSLFDAELTRLGANTTDVESLMTDEWSQWFTSTFEYLFFEGQLNSSAIEDGQTVLIDSIKKSPAGDWPLQIAFRRDPSSETETDVVSNGTFFTGLYAADIKSPDLVAMPWVAANVVSGKDYPSEPQSLSATISGLGFSGWSQIFAQVPLAAELDKSFNYTLLLPSNLDEALSAFNGATQTFLEAHLVPSRLVLGPAPQAFKTLSGRTGFINGQHITTDNVTLSVTKRDVLTNGILIQVIEKYLL
ncbi:hypothetical protein ACM66B_002025 [Microbotryomycetes sp. NB124-2]